MDKRLYLALFIIVFISVSVLCLGAKKEPVLDENQSVGETEDDNPIQIEATNEVPVNGVFAAQIRYTNVDNASSMIIRDYPGNRTWVVDLQKEGGRIGLVFPVESPGYITAEYGDDGDGTGGTGGADGAKRGYEIVPGEQNLTSFIVESWALMHTEITGSLKPGDRAAVKVGDVNKSFTIIVTGEDIEVMEGTVSPDIVFNIYKKDDLWDFVGTGDLGKTIKRMMAEKKMAIQLKTGNLAKLSRYARMARKLGVI